MRTFAALAFVAVAMACTSAQPGPGPVKLSIQLATRQSCGVLSGLEYDTSCAAAVDVRVLDAATRQPITEDCRAVTPADTLGGLLEQSEPLAVVTHLSANRTVIFQVRALQDVDGTGGDLCQDPNQDQRHWLFWGDSAPVDLTRYDVDDGGPSPVVRIVLDCRDCTYTSDCETPPCFGCSGIGPQCPADLPASFCVPTVSCGKACDTDTDCFEGARGCVDHECDTAAITGELCSPCGGGVGCADGFTCVVRPGQPAFCAELCPGADHVCPTGTKCNRLHNGLERAN